ncbi:MAG: hypothetical protein CL947_04435 [Epsilonproteobacteria bacterium]|nr:hypothetical protein [Campylobacterota bacterium]
MQQKLQLLLLFITILHHQINGSEQHRYTWNPYVTQQTITDKQQNLLTVQKEKLLRYHTTRCYTNNEILLLKHLLSSQPYDKKAIHEWIMRHSQTPFLFDVSITRGQTLPQQLLHHRDITNFELCIHCGAQCNGLEQSEDPLQHNATVLHDLCLKDENLFQNFLTTLATVINRNPYVVNLQRGDNRTPAIIMFLNNHISDETTLQGMQLLQTKNSMVIPYFYNFIILKRKHKTKTLRYVQNVMQQSLLTPSANKQKLYLQIDSQKDSLTTSNNLEDDKSNKQKHSVTKALTQSRSD